MEDPRLFVQMYKINPTLVVEKTSLMMAIPDKPYTLFRMQHLELIDSNVDNKNEVTIEMGNTKMSNWFGNTIIISCNRKDQLEHQNKNCMAMRDMAKGVVQEVIFGNCRRSYESNAGETITFNVNDFLHRLQVHRVYMSWHNGGLPSTSDIDNFSSAFNRKSNTLISHVGDYLTALSITASLWCLT